jgi:hypothetical protein
MTKRDSVTMVQHLRSTERERCAKIAETPELWMPQEGRDKFPANSMHKEAGRAIAAAIRADAELTGSNK